MSEEATTVSYILMRPKRDTGWYQPRARVEFGTLSEIVEYGQPGQPERAVEAVANLLSTHGFEYDSEASWKEINGGYSIEVKKSANVHS